MPDGRFVAYYRVSTQQQGQSGLGLEAQQAAVRGYLGSGTWELLDEVTEVETGTRKGNKRPGLAQALATCKREKATLLIAKLDRLARNVHFISGLLEAGVEFVCVDMPQANRLTIHVMAAVAEQEAEFISKRTKEALAAAKARGVKIGTPRNLTHAARKKGAQAAGEVVSAQAREAYRDLAGRIARMRSDGQSLRNVADILNAQGHRTRRGAPFTAATVTRILEREQAAF